MERKEIIKNLMNNLKRYDTYPERKVGGQSCGIPPVKIKLRSEEMGISIETDFYRSQIKNYELVRTLMELAFEEMVK